MQEGMRPNRKGDKVMKCDELKVYEDIDDYIGYDDTPPMMYEKSEVDAAIAELKAEINRKEAVEKRWFERCMEARSENVRLKRALWLARADRAHVTTLLWNVYCYQNNCLYFRDFMNVKSNPFRNLPKKTAMEWSDLWESIETKCLDKAKEYK